MHSLLNRNVRVQHVKKMDTGGESTLPVKKGLIQVGGTP